MRILIFMTDDFSIFGSLQFFYTVFLCVCFFCGCNLYNLSFRYLLQLEYISTNVVNPCRSIFWCLQIILRAHFLALYHGKSTDALYLIRNQQIIPRSSCFVSWKVPRCALFDLMGDVLQDFFATATKISAKPDQTSRFDITLQCRTLF